MVLRLYADESADDGSSIFRVAGYLMTHNQWERLDEAIGEALGSLEWFHMKGGDAKKHPVVYHNLLGLITPDSVLAGISVSLRKREYDSLTAIRAGKQPMRYWMGSSYAFLVQLAMNLCGEWCQENAMTDQWIAYFFEAGHPSQGDANVFADFYSENAYREKRVRAKYASHTFLAKEGPLSRVLIASDILAWHLTNWRRGGPQSEELKHLLHVSTRYKDWDGDFIRSAIAASQKYMKEYDKAGKLRKPKA